MPRNFHNDHRERRRADPRWGRLDAYLRASTNDDDSDSYAPRTSAVLVRDYPTINPRRESEA